MAKTNNVTPINSQLESQFEAKLEEWGIDRQTASRCGLSLETNSQLTFVPSNPPDAKTHTLGGIKIQYFDLNGKPMPAAQQAKPFHRYRYLFKTGGFLDLEKICKYSQEPRTPPLPYFPNVIDWSLVVDDITQDVYITEGEMKALKASLEGFPTIALGGVDAFRSLYKRGVTFLEALEKINWYRRNVYIVYDSDISTKPDVSRAMNDLGVQLYNRGALCHVIFLPPIPVQNQEGEDSEVKCGLDDFLVHYGKDEFEKLEAIPILGAKPLIDMNTRHCYVKQLNIMVDLYDMHQIKVDNGFATRFSNIEFYQFSVDGEEIKAKRSNVGKAWLNWPSRNQVSKLTFAPGADRYIESDGQRQLNTWRGWGVEPKKGLIKPFSNLIDFLFQSCSQEEKAWVWKWLAYPIQHPGTKLFTSIVIHSIGQGTGKTMLGELMGKIYGPSFGKIGQSQLQGNFNSWMDSKQFILGDEISGTGTADARRVADQLKDYITGTMIEINRKFLPPYSIPNYVNFLFTSNHPDAFFVENDDRRNLIVEAPHKAESAKFYAEIAKWRDNDGPSFLMHHLLNYDLNGFDPYGRAPLTSAKEQMISLSRGDLGQWVYDLIHDDHPIMVGKVKTTCELWTVKQLITMFDPMGEKRISDKAMTNELRKNGARPIKGGTQVRLPDGSLVRLWAVRRPDHWAKIDSASTVISHYLKRFASESTIRQTQN